MMVRRYDLAALGLVPRPAVFEAAPSPPRRLSWRERAREIALAVAVAGCCVRWVCDASSGTGGLPLSREPS